MIDFQSGGLLTRLGPSDPREIAAELAPILVDGEAVRLSFKGMRDSVVFTNKRLITINIQGLTGKKRDYSSLPYSKIQAWSVETAGGFDVDAELDLWFSGLGAVRLNFKGRVDIRTIGQLIGTHVLAASAGASTKTCPDCVETILADAKVCKHCSYRFAPAALSCTPSPAPTPKTTPTKNASQPGDSAVSAQAASADAEARADAAAEEAQARAEAARARANELRRRAEESSND